MLNLDSPIIRTYDGERLQCLSDAIAACLPDATTDTTRTLALMRQAIDKEMERRQRVAERRTVR